MTARPKQRDKISAGNKVDREGLPFGSPLCFLQNVVFEQALHNKITLREGDGKWQYSNSVYYV
jgi:hypothetical protein